MALRQRYALPSEPLVPAPGNEYVLWNISMPDSYYPAAEQEFKTAVDTFMADSRKDISVFQASTDFTVVDKRNLDLKPGQRIRLGSDKFFPDTGYRDIRIVAISRSVVQPGSMTLKMSDVLSTGRISRIENQISEVTQITRQVSSEFPDIIKSWEETPASDTTLYSSRKSEREFLNKRRGGTVEGITRFLKRQQLDEGFRTSDFASGITGFGAQIDGRGAGELESLFIRRFLEVPELRYNRVGISVGDDWSAPGAGVIESVDKDQKLVTLKLEEGEIGAVAVGDICMGIFHDFDPSNNGDGRFRRRPGATSLSQASQRSISVSRRSWATATSGSATAAPPVGHLYQADRSDGIDDLRGLRLVHESRPVELALLDAHLPALSSQCQRLGVYGREYRRAVRRPYEPLRLSGSRCRAIRPIWIISTCKVD